MHSYFEVYKKVMAEVGGGCRSEVKAEGKIEGARSDGSDHLNWWEEVLTYTPLPKPHFDIVREFSVPLGGMPTKLPVLLRRGGSGDSLASLGDALFCEVSRGATLRGPEEVIPSHEA